MTIMTNTQFVKIDLDEDEDEQQIFDTINSLGVNLTTAELLKNYFFSRERALYPSRRASKGRVGRKRDRSPRRVALRAGENGMEPLTWAAWHTLRIELGT